MTYVYASLGGLIVHSWIGGSPLLELFRLDHLCITTKLFRTLRIGLTVPVMDISGLYQINGEVFILPLEVPNNIIGGYVEHV